MARPAIDKAAECTDAARKAELEKMGDGLMWISENPARTFWEACQAAIMYQLLLDMDAGYPALAFGRFDQYTWPFLKADLEAGRITMDEAQEIVDAFFLKANCFYGAAPPFLNAIIGVGNTYQHTTIGGVDPDTGEDATNPVTYMVLETIGRLMLHDPTISLRINKNTPDELWECAIETTKLVGGLPLFQNDEVIIPALMRELGFELEGRPRLQPHRLPGDRRFRQRLPCAQRHHAARPPSTTASIFDMAINNGINPFNGERGASRPAISMR